MKKLAPLLAILFIVSCANGKDVTFIGSTPAAHVIRVFLGIPFTDSIDFIRWKITYTDRTYKLQCNYGIGKPNTNGFYNGGTTVQFSGNCVREKNFIQLQNGNKTLKIVELNNDLVHFLDTKDRPLIGNAGWSFTLNNIAAHPAKAKISSSPGRFKDSVSFVGRTPCAVPGIIPKGNICYKIKWHIVLYANSQAHRTWTVRVTGTPYRDDGGKKGKWKVLTENGRSTYQLSDENGKPFIYLLQIDPNILVFTDADGKLLVGDEDFSYSLSREKD